MLLSSCLLRALPITTITSLELCSTDSIATIRYPAWHLGAQAHHILNTTGISPRPAPAVPLTNRIFDRLLITGPRILRTGGWIVEGIRCCSKHGWF